jgi:hypothetical protein
MPSAMQPSDVGTQRSGITVDIPRRDIAAKGGAIIAAVAFLRAARSACAWSRAPGEDDFARMFAH